MVISCKSLAIFIFLKDLKKRNCKDPTRSFLFLDCKTRVVAAEPEQLGVRVQPTSDVSWVLHLMIVDQQEACGYGLPLGPQRVTGEGGVCKHLRPTIDHHFGLISERL